MTLDALDEQPRTLAKRQRHAFHNDVGAVMIEVVTRHVPHAATDALADPVVFIRAEQMAVAFEYVLADRDHLLGAQAGIDAQVLQGTVEALHVLLQLERLAAETARHVEGAVAIEPA
jgi:hypothetical protein